LTAEDLPGAIEGSFLRELRNNKIVRMDRINYIPEYPI
jgi:hypothetical protein